MNICEPAFSQGPNFAYLFACLGRRNRMAREISDMISWYQPHRSEDARTSMGQFMKMWLWLEVFAVYPHEKSFKDRSDETWCCFHRNLSNGIGLEPMSNIQMVGPAPLFWSFFAILDLKLSTFFASRSLVLESCVKYFRFVDGIPYWHGCCIHICYGLDRHGRKAPMSRLASLLVLLAVSGAVLVFRILRPG